MEHQNLAWRPHEWNGGAVAGGIILGAAGRIEGAQCGVVGLHQPRTVPPPSLCTHAASRHVSIPSTARSTDAAPRKRPVH